MPVGRTLFAGSPYLGVYLRASDHGVVVPPSAPPALVRELERILGVPAVRTSVMDSELVGAFLASNSTGIVVGDEIDPAERARLERLAPVTSVRVRQNAMGNNLLANDHGAIVHPDFSDEALHRVHRALKVPVARGTIAGLATVGMAGVATNRGVVVHPRTTDHEAALVETTLGVPVHRSTANFGIPVVGACLVANSRAFLAGRPTTPVEFAHLQEGLNVLD
ncbi:MAG TPA: translation initiation factor IF-6 [Thermoplasmata archaeon]|nr:translation initiation factor IF-6 [Thermoplasmata archaeon]